MVDTAPHTARRPHEVARWAAVIGGELGLPMSRLGELTRAARNGTMLDGQEGRILDVARAWQDLTRTLPRHKAVEALREGLGTDWDPVCVGALIWALAKVTLPQRASDGAQRPGPAVAHAPLGA